MDTYLTNHSIPDNVTIKSITCKVETNKNDIDLKHIYNNATVSKEGIQIIKHNGFIKSIAETLSNKKRRRLVTSKCYNNAITFIFEHNSIKLFPNGNLHVVGIYDVDTIQSCVNEILTVIGPGSEIIEITVCMLNYLIPFVDLNLLKTKLKESDKVFFNNYSGEIYKYENNTLFLIKDGVVVSSKCFEDVNKVSYLIKSFVPPSSFRWYKPWTW